MASMGIPRVSAATMRMQVRVPVPEILDRAIRMDGKVTIGVPAASPGMK